MSGVAGYARPGAHPDEELVRRHAPLVQRIAHHLIGRLPASVQIEDLVQAGMLGLLDAARNYAPSQGASFETYAGIRIKGAMLDELRRADWTPRSVQRRAREVTEAIQRIEHREGHDARDSDVAQELGIELEQYHRVVRDIAACRVASFEEASERGGAGGDEGGPGRPWETFARERLRRDLAEAVAGLPEREALVLSLYHEEELNLREIGEVLGVSESRVCQIHGQALARLRARMQDWSA